MAPTGAASSSSSDETGGGEAGDAAAAGGGDAAVAVGGAAGGGGGDGEGGGGEGEGGDGGGGDGGGDGGSGGEDGLRSPQSVQSVPNAQREYSEPGPPSSHMVSLAIDGLLGQVSPHCDATGVAMQSSSGTITRSGGYRLTWA